MSAEQIIQQVADNQYLLQQRLLALAASLENEYGIKSQEGPLIIDHVAQFLNLHNKCESCGDSCKPVKIHIGYADEMDPLSDKTIKKLCGHCAINAYNLPDMGQCEICDCFYTIESRKPTLEVVSPPRFPRLSSEVAPQGFFCRGHTSLHLFPVCKYLNQSLHLPCYLKNAENDSQCALIQFDAINNVRLQDWFCSDCWQKEENHMWSRFTYTVILFPEYDVFDEPPRKKQRVRL